jgi:phosphoglycerate dehydrogenase-like enzyme
MRIAFLDDDHVMKLTRLTLSGGDHDWLRAFFAPEVVDVEDLFALAGDLRGSEVTLGEPTDVDAIVFRRGRVPRALFDACPGLRLVQRLGEDASGIDLEAARERGVHVSCLPRRTLRLTAEHALLLMLALAKRLLEADRAVRAGPAAPEGDGVAYNWPGLAGIGGLVGRTLGIVGLGEVGTLVARRARAFEMRVIYAGRRPSPRAAELGVERRTLDALLEEADVVSIHVPGTTENERLIGAPELARMRPGALLVNTSRGRIVDEDALYGALVSGRLAGAGLDVHAHEPRPPSDRFCALENVILTPHVSGGSRRNTLDEVALMYDNLRAVARGEPPAHGRVT